MQISNTENNSINHIFKYYKKIRDQFFLREKVIKHKIRQIALFLYYPLLNVLFLFIIKLF